MTRLLKEYYALCKDGLCRTDILNEDERRMRTDGFTILTGIIQVADETNGNNRIYPFEVLDNEIKKYDKLVRESRAYGECDHSDKEIVELQNVSHMVTRWFWEGKRLMGVIKVLKTPKGQILEAILQGGGVLGISSRALGSLTETQGGNVVNEDLALIAFDIVSQPSAPGAYLHLQESQQRNFDPQKVFSKGDRIYRALMDIK
jgi:hypothetical protein